MKTLKVLVALTALLLTTTAWGKIYEPDFTIHGEVTIQGELTTSGIVEVRLKGDGFIDMDQLMAWVNCSPRAVELVYDTEVADPLTAEKLLVVSDMFSGAFDEQKIFVQPGATIFAITNGQQALIELDRVEADDQVIAYGVEACEGNEEVDFFAFVLLVIRGE